MIATKMLPQHLATSERTKAKRCVFWHDAIRDGSGLQRYENDRSRAAAAVALGYVNAGVSFHEFKADMTAPGISLDWAVRRSDGRARLPQDIDKRLEGTWRQAEKRYQDRPPIADQSSCRWELAQARTAAQATPFGGQRGSTDVAVLSALHALGDKLGRVVFSVSVRDIAEAAGLGIKSVSTADRSLRRLAADGVWLRKVSPGTRTEAATYRLLVPDMPAASLNDVEPDHKFDKAPTQVHEFTQNDAFAWLGLGRTAGRIAAGLGDEGRTATEIATQLGLHVRTVRRHLESLEEHEMASADGGVWTRIRRDPEDLAAHLVGVAENLGTAGTAECRRLAHFAQRKVWELEIAKYAWLRRKHEAERRRRRQSRSRLALAA